MKYRIDELLLIENLTYFDDIPPLSKIIHHNDKYISDYFPNRVLGKTLLLNYSIHIYEMDQKRE